MFSKSLLWRTILLPIIISFLISCTISQAPQTPPATQPAVISPGPPSVPPSGGEEGGADESIFIREPGPGSRLTSPVHVAGIADPTFEQNLVVRLVLSDGTELAVVPTIIDADPGQRGPYQVDLPFIISGEQQAFIQVYATSPRDGGITHLASVGVTIADSGPEILQSIEVQPERLMIYQPSSGAAVSGGVAHIEGFALASFEQTLLVEVLDADGNILASQPVTVAAPDLSQPGPFNADIPYSVATSGPGRIVVRDISPAFGGDVHLASVEVTLEP